MKIIDGKGMVMGRLASYVAKQAMQGEEIAVVNCSNIIITGNKKFIKEKLKKAEEELGQDKSGQRFQNLLKKFLRER